MAVPVLLLIYGNLFKANGTFPLRPSERVRGCVSPAAGLSGLGILSHCVSIVSASCSMTFKSGEGKYCRESKGSVESDCSDPRQLGVGAGKAALRAGLGQRAAFQQKRICLGG